MKKSFVLSLLFFSSPSMAVITDFTNMCGVDEYTNIGASFTPISYTCNEGEFLPANALGCATCPDGATCAGRTFNFNPTTPQGVTYDAPFTQNQNDLCSVHYIFARADFTPIQYTCGAGYYLPADEIECTICPANNLCAGGTYSFNETLSQGIVACESSTYSPTGSAVCYQHILHVGNDIVYLRSTKLTTPSLNIQIVNDIFYANMTTTPTYMNKDSSHYLHILYEGDDYYVCDDTTYVAPSE